MIPLPPDRWPGPDDTTGGSETQRTPRGAGRKVAMILLPPDRWPGPDDTTGGSETQRTPQDRHAEPLPVMPDASGDAALTGVDTAAGRPVLAPMVAEPESPKRAA